jgi:hypothetical protein
MTEVNMVKKKEYLKSNPVSSQPNPSLYHNTTTSGFIGIMSGKDPGINGGDYSDRLLKRGQIGLIKKT